MSILQIIAALGFVDSSPVPHPLDRRLRNVLVQESEDPPIVTKMEPTREYKDHLKKVYGRRDEKVVIHQNKLEHKIVHLQEQVKSLSKQMSKEESLTAIYRAESKALEIDYDKNRRKDLSVEGEGDLESKKMADIGYEAPTAMEEQIGQVSTVIIFGFMILGAATFFLLSYEDPKLRLSTWQAIENVASIFIAVMWFQAFDDLLEAGGWEKHYAVLAALLHAMILFSICVVVSWSVRNKHRYLTALTAVGAHYISFSALHFQNEASDRFFSSHWGLCLLGVAIFLVLLMGIATLHHFIREKTHMNHQEFEDSVDDVENDIGGMVLAFAWTTFVRYLILGRYPEHHDAEPGEPPHSALQRGLLLLYAVLITVAAFFIIPWLDHWMLEHSQTASRVLIRLHLLCYPFITMSCAWAFLLWGEWEFYESLFMGNAMLGRAVFAFLCTTMCIVLLFAFSVVVKRRSDAERARAVGQDARSLQLSKIQAQVDEERERDIRRLVVNMLSLIVAFSWEETFDAAVEGAVEGSAHEATAKVILAIVVAGAVLPVYILYLRPYVDAIDREVHPDGEED